MLRQWLAGLVGHVRRHFGRRGPVAGRRTIFSILMTFWPIAHVSAGEYCSYVVFDVPAVVGFRETTPVSSSILMEDDTFYELTLPISVWQHRKGFELQELLVLVSFGSGLIEVVDYLPQTHRESAVLGTIAVESRSEQCSTLGFSADGAWDRIVRGNATAGVNEKDSATYKYQVLPPSEVAAVSGTLSRRSAVYFKFPSGMQRTLEGERKLVLILRAPKSWRVGYALVTCRAEGKRASVPALEDPYWSSQNTYVVTLFRRHDREAQQLAIEFSQAEAQLHAAAEAWARRRSSRWVDRLADSLGVGKSPIPPDWWQQVVRWPPDAEPPQFLLNLPGDVEHAVGQFLDVRRRLLEAQFAPQPQDSMDTSAQRLPAIFAPSADFTTAQGPMDASSP